MDFSLEKANIKYYDDLLPIITDKDVMINIQKEKIWDKKYLLDHLKESQEYWNSKQFLEQKYIFVWIIVKNNKGIGYLRWENNNNFKLLIFINKKNQNTGIGTEAIKLSIQKLVKYYKDRFLYAEIHKNNIISEKMLIKSGFQFIRKDELKNLKIFRFDLFFNIFPTLNLFNKYSKTQLFNILKKYNPTRITDVDRIYNIKKVKQGLKKILNEDYFSKLNDEYVIYNFNYKKQEYLFDLTDLFAEKCRIKCRYNFIKFSPYDYFKNNKDEIKNYLIKTNKKINRENIRNVIYDPMPKIPPVVNKACTNFKLVFILSILDYFKPKAWLDMSAGWGDRLLGAIIYDIDYYCGIDPSRCLNDIYPKMINKFAPTKKDKYKIIIDGSENVKLNRKFDFLFTSPPFYDFEMYAEEHNQSIIKYNTYDVWMKEFMFKSIKNGWDVLKKDCYFTLYISYKINKRPFFDPINNYILKELKGQFCGSMYFYWEDYEKIRNLYVWKKI